MIIQLNDINFEDILKRNDNIRLMIDCWSPQCELCRHNAATFDELSNELTTKILFAKLNVTNCPIFVSKFQINIIPFIGIIYKGKLEKGYNGIVTKIEILDWLQSRGLCK